MLRCTGFRSCAATALVATAALLVSASAGQAALIMIDATPSKTVVNVDEIFDVQIAADIDRGIMGFGFDLSIPESLVALVGVDIAEPFTPMAAPDGDGLAGLVYPNLISGPNVALATVSLRALAAGTAVIGISVTPGDLTEGFAEIDGFADFVVSPATVSIVAPQLAPTGSGGGGAGAGGPAIPEPLTASLLVLGSLIALKRRR